MKKSSIITVLVSVLTVACTTKPEEAPLVERIAQSHNVIEEDTWHGFHRVKFDFEGYTAWVVEPDCDEADGKPWTWTMQWADAFVDRTGVPQLLEKGWHHVTLEAFETRASDEALELFAHYQRFLVDTLGLFPKARLVGMSWGGFFSTRYAAAHPENVLKIYLDAPLLSFEDFNPENIGLWKDCAPLDGDWADDPRMPVNLAGKIAEAGIPILLLYGGQDQTVNPNTNSEIFIERFKKAGGNITVTRRDCFGHHPHGHDPNRTDPIQEFFQ